MREDEFKAWLAERGANTQAGRNTRAYAVRTIENNLAALGSPHADLDAAWQADRFESLRQRIKDIEAGLRAFVLLPQVRAVNTEPQAARALLERGYSGLGKAVSASGVVCHAALLDMKCGNCGRIIAVAPENWWEITPDAHRAADAGQRPEARGQNSTAASIASDRVAPRRPRILSR